MKRFFKTAGPVDPKIHSCIDPLSRGNLDEFLGLTEQQKYFVLHAPRQTGKTSALSAPSRTGRPRVTSRDPPMRPFLTTDH